MVDNIYNIVHLCSLITDSTIVNGNNIKIKPGYSYRMIKY